VTKTNLVRAAAAGKQLLDENFKSGWSTTVVNGWRYPSPHEGRAGDDFLLRAVWQSLAGIVANDPKESVYLLCQADGDEEDLTGANDYELHFAAGQEPPVDAFWSLTMYSTNYNLVPNPIDRFSLGDRSKGLKRDSDGALSIYIQHETPGEDKGRTGCPPQRDRSSSSCACISHGKRYSKPHGLRHPWRRSASLKDTGRLKRSMAFEAAHPYH
jgi:hypothetical protein